jgi:Flp pilus assembly protein TadD
MNLLATIALARGDAPQAVRWLRQALDINPFDAEARALLDRLER